MGTWGLPRVLETATDLGHALVTKRPLFVFSYLFSNFAFARINVPPGLALPLEGDPLARKLHGILKVKTYTPWMKAYSTMVREHSTFNVS